MSDGGLPEREGEGTVDGAVNKYLDGDRARRRRELLDDLAGERCEELVRTNHALFRLKQPVDSIDVTDAVLRRVHARRAFLPARLRSMVRAGRLGMAAALLLSVLSIALLQRYNPGALRLDSPEAPLSAVLEQSEQDTAAGLHSLTGGFDEIKSLVQVAAIEMSERGAQSGVLPEREPRDQLLMLASSEAPSEGPSEGRLSPSPSASGGLGGLAFAVECGRERPSPALTAGLCAPRGVGPASSPARWSLTPIAGEESRLGSRLGSRGGPLVVSPTPVSLNLRGPVLDLLSGSGDPGGLRSDRPVIDR